MSIPLINLKQKLMEFAPLSHNLATINNAELQIIMKFSVKEFLKWITEGNNDFIIADTVLDGGLRPTLKTNEEILKEFIS